MMQIEQLEQKERDDTYRCPEPTCLVPGKTDVRTQLILVLDTQPTRNDWVKVEESENARQKQITVVSKSSLLVKQLQIVKQHLKETEDVGPPLPSV